MYVPGDAKGEWAAVSRALGGQVIELGPGRAARLNPLDEGPRPAEVDDAAWRVQVSQRRAGLLGALAEATLGRPLGPTERSARADGAQRPGRRASACHGDVVGAGPALGRRSPLRAWGALAGLERGPATR